MKTGELGPMLSRRFTDRRGEEATSYLLPRELVDSWSRRGERLSRGIRREMEARFHSDFASVRVHVGPEAPGIGAAAFCHGEGLYFAPGWYDPSTIAGRAVIAHELAHVVQQRAGRARSPFGRGTAVLHHAGLEAEADQATRCDPARGVGTRPGASVRASGSGDVVQCIHYMYVSEIGHHYQNEEGQPGHRTPFDGAVTNWENRLKAAIVTHRNLMMNRPLPVPGGPSNTPPAMQAQIAAARAEMIKRRTWLEREDFTLDDDGNIDWGQSARNVIYDHQLAAQQLSRISARGGCIFIGAQRLDTSGLVTHLSGPGYAIYVMSQQGNIHVSSHSIGHRHHSSLLAGGNTAAAGELKTDATGKLLWLSNKSGHYAPSPIHLNQIIHQLSKIGVPADYEVVEYAKTDAGGVARNLFGSATEYLNDVKGRDDAPDYELQKLLAYMPLLSDDILARNDWEWRKNLALAPGVYKRNTWSMVPHKAVRQWLKSQGLRPGAPTVQSGAGR